MTLTTHAIVGAAAASFFPDNPAGAAAAFCIAFASHFVLDAIPHWDYRILSASVDPDIGAKLKFDQSLFKDMARIGGDASLGIVLSLVVFGAFASWPLVLIGAIGAILPDALQFVYGHFSHEPLISLQHFHHWIHTERRFKNAPVLGMLSQVIFLIAIIVAARIFLSLW